MRHQLRILAVVTAIGFVPLFAQPGSVVISQVYGGGGNTSVNRHAEAASNALPKGLTLPMGRALQRAGSVPLLDLRPL